ncbi:MAG: zinc-binding dehydrogenase [Myxococcaceae bacterium]|jgi:NADPH2:quinone reductase|nr:zinc-binding dehydrogenase [Myxococcaceae bacterium]
MTTLRAVMLTKKGGPEVLETVELPLPAPGPGEVRVKVLATGVGATDLTMRRGSYPYAPPIPFVPGYESVGVVDAVGGGVTGLREGDRVCALLVHGGYATHVVRGAEHWVKVPDGLDPVEVAASILNGVTAWQMIHREARLTRGQSALVNAANGGVGQALLALLRVHGVEAIGAASTSKHALVRELGATPIDGRGLALDGQVSALRADGVDAAFDGVGGAQTGQCVRATRRGGVTVWYGFVGATGLPALASSAFACFAGARLRGRRGAFYGITMLYRKDPRPFREDLPRLFELMQDRRFVPRIAQRLPLMAAREANERLEAGNIEGKLVLVAEP